MPFRLQDSGIILRPMTESDVDQVSILDRASFPTPWPKEAFLYDLERERSAICWVAELDQLGQSAVLVGSVVVWINGGNAHVGTLAVMPGYRRRGIGRQLLGRVLLECAQRDVRKVTLEARISNLKAQRLYKRFSFNRVGVRPDYYKDTHEDAVVMLLSSLDPEKLADFADCGYH